MVMCEWVMPYNEEENIHAVGYKMGTKQYIWILRSGRYPKQSLLCKTFLIMHEYKNLLEF